MSDSDLREKIVQARYSKYETYDKLDPEEQETIDAVLQAVKAEIGAARIDENERLRYDLGNFIAFSTNDWHKIEDRIFKRQAELRNHFGIGEDV